jgi:hypothetical protein
MHFSRATALVALLAGFTVVLTACPADEKVTNIYETLDQGTGDFPGTPVGAGNVSVDGRAFSNPGEDVTGYRLFDSGHGTSIVLQATTESGNNHLYASYNDGNSFTPPVELVGQNQDPTQSVNLDQAFVVFLRPGNERDGDAIVGFIRFDLDDDGNSNPNIGPNRRLYAAYFDRTWAQTPVHATTPQIRYGFDTLAPAIDLTDDSYAGANVFCAAPVTEGLRGAGSFPTVGGNECAFRQGDATTTLNFVWIQAESSTSSLRLYHRDFDLTAANTANAFAASGSQVALDPGHAVSDAVDTQEIQVYDNAVFFLMTSGTDTLLMASAYDAGAAPPDFIPFSYRVGPTAAVTGTVQFLPGRASLYGPDEGLVNIVGVFQDIGSAYLNEMSIFAFQFQNQNLAAPFTLANDSIEVDAGSGSGGIPYDVDPLFPFSTFINRTGTWIGVIWLQAASPPPSIPMSVVFGNAIQTTRSGSALPFASTTAGALRVDTSTSGAPAMGTLLQQEIGYKGIQSDPNTVSLAYRLDDVSGNDTLRLNKVIFSPGTPPLFNRGTETIVHFPIGTLDLSKVVVAEGGGGTGAAGDAVLYYVKDVATVAPSSFRAIQNRGGTELTIGSLQGAAGSYEAREAVSVSVITTPANEDITGTPAWTGTQQHVFLTEYRYLDSAGSTALRHRVLDLTAGGTDADNFNPVVDGTAPPADLDTGQDTSVSELRLLADGSRVGAFFVQGGHLWYNEWSGAVWYARTTESPGPQLVDDLNPALVNLVTGPPDYYNWKLYESSLRGSPPGLFGSQVLYAKVIDPGGSLRLFIRMRNR